MYGERCVCTCLFRNGSSQAAPGRLAGQTTPGVV